MIILTKRWLDDVPVLSMGQTGTALETLVIGLDGACHRILEPLFADGVMPNVADIFELGTSGRLESQVPPWTASAWPSLYTGMNPGKHGVFGFLEFEGYDWDVVSAASVGERTLWEYLDYHDRTSVVVNAPVSAPPPAIDGAVVPGYLAPEDPQCTPAGLLDEVREAIGEYRVYARGEGEAGASIDDRTAEYATLAEMRAEAFAYLADRFDPEFGFLQFQHTDTVLHEAPEDSEALREVYGAADEAVGDAIAAADPDTIVLVSDHGLGPYETRVRVNEILRDGGFLQGVKGGKGMPTWAAIRDDGLAEGRAGAETDMGPLARALSAGAAFGVTAQRVASALDRVNLRDPLERVVPPSLIRATSEQVDFPSSAAYVRSRVECGIRINLAGREPEGVVPRNEYEVLRDHLIAELRDLETPDGDSVFEDVARRERYFNGPETHRAVDVVTVPNEYDHYVTTWLMGDHFAPPEPPGWDHKRDGVIAMAGTDIDPGPIDAHLFDVAPTVLATMGLPASDRMDGRPLAPVDDPGEQAYPAADPQATDVSPDEAVEDRLANLGYLD